jgi:hypothetical protein
MYQIIGVRIFQEFKPAPPIIRYVGVHTLKHTSVALKKHMGKSVFFLKIMIFSQNDYIGELFADLRKQCSF